MIVAWDHGNIKSNSKYLLERGAKRGCKRGAVKKLWLINWPSTNWHQSQWVLRIHGENFTMKWWVSVGSVRQWKTTWITRIRHKHTSGAGAFPWKKIFQLPTTFQLSCHQNMLRTVLLIYEAYAKYELLSCRLLHFIYIWMKWEDFYLISLLNWANLLFFIAKMLLFHAKNGLKIRVVEKTRQKSM